MLEPPPGSCADRWCYSDQDSKAKISPDEPYSNRNARYVSSWCGSICLLDPRRLNDIQLDYLGSARYSLRGEYSSVKQ